MNTALLVMDVQNGIVDRIGNAAEPLLGTLAAAVSAARSARMPVLYVRVAFRAGAPEVSRRNRSFAAIAGSGTMELDHTATQVHPAVAPMPGETVVIKKRVSAFAGSDWRWCCARSKSAR